MSAARKLLQLELAEPFDGDVRAYLSAFFGDAAIPEQLLTTWTWDELQDYLATHVLVTRLPETRMAQHRVYGFEKDRLLKLFFKHVLY
jgi:hypothetical protein